MIKFVLLVIIIPFSLLGTENANKPLSNLYIEQALNPFSIKISADDPFNRDFGLPQKSRANVIVTNSILIGTAIAVVNPEARRKFKERWELITSPNHASPLNQGPFHFRTFEEEKDQDTQADKGVHFLYHYLPVKPLSFLCEYIIDGLPFGIGQSKRKERWVSDEAFYLSTAIVFFGGFFEEYVDGKEKDEGFSVLDFVANGAGSAYAIMKHNGYFDNLYIFWSYRSPPDDWKWPKWDYMPGFEFRVVFDMSSFLFKEEKKQPTLFKWWSDNVGYIPDVERFGTTLPYNQKKSIEK